MSSRILDKLSEKIDIDFYGSQVRFYYDESLKQRLSSGIDKNTISDYWSILSQSDYDELLIQLRKQRQSRQLNDWESIWKIIG